MNRLTALLLAGLIALAGCAEPPIRKANCWNSMTLLPQDEDCEFQHVPAR